MSTSPTWQDMQRVYDQVKMLYSLLTPEQKAQYLALQHEQGQSVTTQQERTRERFLAAQKKG